MEKTNQPYTLGIWNVMRGNEEAFIIEWRTFARWTAEHFPDGGTGHLLQDSERSSWFVSFGSWKDSETIKAWRAAPEFQAFAAKAKSLCENFEPHSMKLVATSSL